VLLVLNLICSKFQRDLFLKGSKTGSMARSKWYLQSSSNKGNTEQEVSSSSKVKFERASTVNLVFHSKSNETLSKFE
jgi:hypothetical protein